MHVSSLIWMAAMGLAAAGGCNPVGPRAIAGARQSYNEVISRTSNEQLLLNLVRLRYRDTPFFLEITSVSTQYVYDVSVGAAAGKTDGAPASGSVSAGIGFTEKPTVTYAPLRGEKFVKQLLSPVRLETILLMYHSGWSIERIFRGCVQQVGLARNAPGASGPTPDRVPPYKDFIRAARILRGFQVLDQLSMGAAGDKDEDIVLRLSTEAARSVEAAELRKLLGVRGDLSSLRLSARVGDAPGEVVLVTRSLLGVMFYLSQSVQVPARDVARGHVTVTKDESGKPFDWEQVTGGILRVQSKTGMRPSGAAVSVAYRGAWFYIEDADLDSKSTFSMLAQLFALQSGDVKGQAPVLTLPLGG